MSQPSTPSENIAAGGQTQAIAMGINALGDLAYGSMRSRMSRADAAALRAAGQEKAARIRVAGQQELGRARAGAAGLNVSVSSGSVLEAERNIVRNVEQDAGVAILSGENRATAQEVAADYYQRGGVLQALDGMMGAASKWRRSQYATPQPAPYETGPFVSERYAARSPLDY